ncbi:MAG TPA: TIGR00266 family protein [Actinobacteria bacterium]|nr:TIGR00266 family protein [Actinomycetota bacterium]
MREQIHGTTMPVLSVHLDPGESVVAEVGEFSWMTDSIQMSTNVGSCTGGRGLMGALKRVTGGSPLPMSTYTAQGAAGTISFASKVPGSILPVDVAPGSDYLVHRRGFLAGSPGIQISAGFQQSFRAGIFAGEGFVLQRISGQGRAWAELSGEVIPYELAPGQSLRVHPGHVGMFQASVSFQVVRVPGITNRYFGGDAHHFAVLTGPGTVWLQSMPLPQLAAALSPFMGAVPDHRQAGAGAAAGSSGTC